MKSIQSNDSKSQKESTKDFGQGDLSHVEWRKKYNLPKLAYSVTDVASMLECSEAHIYRLVRANKIPHKRLGRLIVIPAVALMEWLNSPQNWS